MAGNGRKSRREQSEAMLRELVLNVERVYKAYRISSAVGSFTLCHRAGAGVSSETGDCDEPTVLWIDRAG